MQFISHLLTMLATGLLALPPGWCCVVPPPPAAEVEREAPCHVCCHREPVPVQPSSDEPVMPRPTVNCCCQLDLTLPQKDRAVPPAPEWAIVTPVLTFAATQPVSGPGTDVEPEPDGLSPPLHVLHCVWLC